jgi:hypothetical protein
MTMPQDHARARAHALVVQDIDLAVDQGRFVATRPLGEVRRTA